MTSRDSALILKLITSAQGHPLMLSRSEWKIKVDWRKNRCTLFLYISSNSLSSVKHTRQTVSWRVLMPCISTTSDFPLQRSRFDPRSGHLAYLMNKCYRSRLSLSISVFFPILILPTASQSSVIRRGCNKPKVARVSLTTPHKLLWTRGSVVATSRKVAGSIPDGFFSLPNPSSRTMALGSTKPLT
jgi:hypothetical protein